MSQTPEQSRKYYLENRERILQRVKTYRETNPDKIRENNRAWRKKNPVRKKELQDRYRVKQGARLVAMERAGALRRKYGLTTAQFDEMSKAQNHLCAICNKKKKLCVDHCHKTGRVRLLLCAGCNLVVGFVESYPGFLATLTAYATICDRIREGKQ